MRGKRGPGGDEKRSQFVVTSILKVFVLRQVVIHSSVAWCRGFAKWLVERIRRFGQVFTPARGLVVGHSDV